MQSKQNVFLFETCPCTNFTLILDAGWKWRISINSNIKATFSVRFSELLTINYIIWSIGHCKSSWSPLLPLTCFMKKMNFCGSLWATLEYFHEKKLPTDHCFNIEAHTGICAKVSRNTLLYLPCLKSPPYYYSCWFQLDWQFQEHSIVMGNIY